MKPPTTQRMRAGRQSGNMSLTITCGTCYASVEAPEPLTRAEEIALKEGIGPYALPCHCPKTPGKAKASA